MCSKFSTVDINYFCTKGRKEAKPYRSRVGDIWRLERENKSVLSAAKV